MSTRPKIFGLDALNATPWQMTLGERAALEGVLTYVRPKLAIEIGTAEGGSLTRIAAHAEEVHSFDLVAPQLAVAEQEHVHLHAGDSHVELPGFLAELAEQGRRVDFAFVDGDHTTEGTRRDVLDLVESDACQDTVLLMHDAANEWVRAGIAGTQLESHPKVTVVDYDFVPGFIARGGPFDGELWGGFAYAVVGHRGAPVIGSPAVPYDRVLDVARRFMDAPADPQSHVAHLEARIAELEDRAMASFPARTETGELFERLAEAEREVERLTTEVATVRHALNVVQSSVSWRVTAPLRTLMARRRP